MPSHDDQQFAERIAAEGVRNYEDARKLTRLAREGAQAAMDFANVQANPAHRQTIAPLVAAVAALSAVVDYLEMRTR